MEDYTTFTEQDWSFELAFMSACEYRDFGNAPDGENVGVDAGGSDAFTVWHGAVGDLYTLAGAAKKLAAIFAPIDVGASDATDYFVTQLRRTTGAMAEPKVYEFVWGVIVEDEGRKHWKRRVGIKWNGQTVPDTAVDGRVW